MTDETKQDDPIIELTDVVEDGEEQAFFSEDVSVSEAQMASALERVIEKKFAEKIEPLLFETMERVILQEIQKIKTTLLKDMDRIDPL
ncbi:MAG: hypothetical protein U5K27_06775 [Desulfotignum sp.]|nr:hypothetical protein [Desulfotignum sp.]